MIKRRMNIKFTFHQNLLYKKVRDIKFRTKIHFFFFFFPPREVQGVESVKSGTADNNNAVYIQLLIFKKKI